MEFAHQASIRVADARLHADDYSTADYLIVSHFERLAGEDIGAEFDKCLALGVRVAEVAAPVLTVDLVRREFEATVVRHEDLIVRAGGALREEIAAVLDPLLGVEGLPRTLRETTTEIEQELRKYFDEESARSIASIVTRKVEEALQAGERRVAHLLQEALDTNDETHGIGKVYRSLRNEGEAVQVRLTDLIATVSAMVARRAEVELSPRKGPSYQSDVFLEVARIARISGDAADETGFITGEANRKRGDIVVTLNTALTNKVAVNFTIEAMDRAEVSQRAVLKELDEAKTNRNAHAAIAVIASAQTPAAGGQALRWFPGNRFICVLDKEAWSPIALEVAYCWARIETLRRRM